MVIMFSAIVLVALAYALAIGWEKTKVKHEEQTEQPRRVSDQESSPEIAQAGERVYTAATERSLRAE
jgi:hypothetical protein